MEPTDATPEKQAREPQADTSGASSSGPRESVIDADTSFDGHFETRNDLRVRGSISGEIVCWGLLTIEKPAISEARIDARSVVVHGTMHGDIACEGRLWLGSTAEVTATVRAGSLVIEHGAMLNGPVEIPSQFAEWPRPRAIPASKTTGELRAYCMRCQNKQLIQDGKQITMQNGRPAVGGVCDVCGAKVSRILSTGDR